MSVVGEALYNERIKQGLTISDISKKTNIREYYIISIEKGEFDKLPGDVYAKGFITNYARIVDLDEKFLISEYKKEIMSNFNDADNIKAENEKSLTQNENKISRLQKINVSKPLVVKIVLFILAFIVMVAIFLSLMNFFDNNEPINSSLNKRNLANPIQEDASLLKDKLDVVNAEIIAKQKCWTEVEIDGKNEFYGMLDKDQKKSWKGKKISIKVGNINAVDIFINRKKYIPTEQETVNFVVKKEFNIADK